MAHNRTDERVAALTEKLAAGIQDIYTSGRYGAYLRVMSKFYHYSFSNAMLIYLQCPSATLVAGYAAWKTKFGLTVKRGEKGIPILAPCAFRRDIMQEEDMEEGEKPETGPPVRFKVATVFDISQTEGRELPTLGVSSLAGTIEDFQNLFDRLSVYAPVPVEYGEISGTAKGYFSAAEHRIVLRRDMSEMQAIKHWSTRSPTPSCMIRVKYPQKRTNSAAKKRSRQKAWPMLSSSISALTQRSILSATLPPGAAARNCRN